MAISVKDVAAAASVSVGTVSNVLNRPDKVSPETVVRVHEAIARLGFVRNDAARQLRAGRSRSIGLIVTDSANPFFAQVARGAEERAALEGMTVLIGNSDQNPARETAYLDLFLEQRVNGVLLTPAGVQHTPVERLRVAGIVPVLVDAHSPVHDVRSVAVDDVEGGFVAATHLLSMGRRRIAFVSGPLRIPQIAERLEGVRRALAASTDARLEIVEQPSQTVLNGRQVGESFARRPSPERPDAVFCANDLLAIGVMQGAAILGDIRIPEDVALVGYDDIDFAQSAIVPLSSIRRPARAIGATAIELLLDALASPAEPPRQVRFQPELVRRASTGR